MTEVIGEVRAAVGQDFTLMVDVQYAFPDADTCVKLLKGHTSLGQFRFVFRRNAAAGR